MLHPYSIRRGGGASEADAIDRRTNGRTEHTDGPDRRTDGRTDKKQYDDDVDCDDDNEGDSDDAAEVGSVH